MRDAVTFYYLLKELTALRRFKAYVYQRLDEAGIPTHPTEALRRDPPDKKDAAGC